MSRSYRLIFFALATLSISAVYSQTNKSSSGADWPMYNRDLAGTRFSPLKQINASNVSKLTRAWTYKLPPEGGIGNVLMPSEVFQEVTPIVVDNVMYLPSGNRVVALQADSGKEIWSWVVPTGLVSQRGIAYWPGDKDNPPRVIFTTAHKMVALNAKTGKIDPGFGKEGEIPLEVAYSGAPVVFKNVLLIGSNFYGPGERHINPALDQAGGQVADSRAFDVRTGKLMWTFHNIPRPGEPGNDTWQNDSWKNRTGNNTWAFALTVDEQRGIVYIPVSEPGANFYGGDRPGINLYGDCILALDATTGKLKWYFQTVHHELWDYNLPPAPSLFDIVKDGKRIPALAQVGKIGYMFILNRETGKPIFGVEERPVPKGDVPGESYNPTQPFPVKPPPIARVSFTKDDIVTAQDTTPEHAAACQALYDKLQITNSGPYTPWPYHAEGSNSKPAIIFPGFDGGVNWGGTAVDPDQQYIFFETKDSPVIGWLTKNPRYTPGNSEGQVEYLRTGPPGANFTAQINGPDGKPAGRIPCFKGPWARLIAVNAKTGDFAWQVPLGTVAGLPKDKELQGDATSAGPIATAGGLVFIGAARDSRFRAFDSKTGKELWSDQMEYTATAVPMTYQGKNGKQYVAIVASARGRASKAGNEALMVYALP